jgi:cytochrome c oxidase subunit 3
MAPQHPSPHGVNGHVPRQGDAEPVPGSANLFMTCFLAALSMLFAAGIVLYFVVRYIAPQWPPAGAPELPRTLWLSTGVILLSSVTIQAALSAIRRDNRGGLQAWLIATLVLACVFMASQLSGWHALTAVEMSQPVRQFVATFMILTVLHALHVLGGIIPLVVCTVRSGRGLYSADEHQGVFSLVRYWHFLGVVWLILFAVLQLARHK